MSKFVIMNKKDGLYMNESGGMFVPQLDDAKMFENRMEASEYMIDNFINPNENKIEEVED